MAVAGNITLPPFPRAATAAIVSVNSMAVGLENALQFVASNAIWEVTDRRGAPGSFVTSVNATTGAQTAI